MKRILPIVSAYCTTFFCFMLIVIIPSVCYSQDTGNSNIDSIKNEIINSLKNVNFYYFSGTKSHPNGEEKLNNRPYYTSLKKPKSISISNNQVILSFNKREESVSLLSEIKHNKEVILFSVGPFGLGWTEGDVIIWGNLLVLQSPDNIIKLQKKYEYDYYWGDFDKILSDYHQLKEKPAITEEQRKYIVQANSTNEKKDYSNAMKLYSKVIETNPFSYPAAYFNLALISAQAENYVYAIVNMKKYILLVPQAEDLRSAQDKVYEWEFELEK